MKLNIYQNKRVVKTYTADAYDLLWGVVEDVASAVNLDELKTGSEAEIMKLVLNLVLKSMGTVKELMKDVFEGITDEELKHTKVKEIAQVLVDVVQYTILQLNLFKSKN